jgi:hypothetical protein
MRVPPPKDRDLTQNLHTKGFEPVTALPEYKLKIFTDALIVLYEAEGLNAAIVEDIFAAPDNFLDSLYDESGDDIVADLGEIQTGIRKAQRTTSRRKYAQSEQGKIPRKMAQKAWSETEGR